MLDMAYLEWREGFSLLFFLDSAVKPDPLMKGVNKLMDKIIKFIYKNYIQILVIAVLLRIIMELLYQMN